MGRLAEYSGDGRHDVGVAFGGRDEQFGLKRIEFNERDWTAQISELSDHRDDIQQQKAKAKVAELIKSIGRELRRDAASMSQSALASAVGTKVNRPPFLDAIRELELRGSIVRVPEFFAGNKKKCKGWKLAESRSCDQETE